MNNRQTGIGLIVLAFLLAKFLPFTGLSTNNIAIIMGFGAIAWVGVIMLSPFPNPAGPDHKMWKMLLNGTLGFAALLAVVVVGIDDTDNRLKKELKTYGVVTNAIVVSKDYTTTPGRWGKEYHTYYLTVQFEDQNGTQQQLKCEVADFEFRSAGAGIPLKINYSSRNLNMHKLLFK